MTKHQNENYAERIKPLARHLMQIPRVVRVAQQRGTTVDAEAWQIATALADIQESARSLFDNLVPQLLVARPDSTQADDILNEVGEEYRQILYHIRDTKLFEYLE